ncbi:sensor histidine kinase [Flaviaesturariibacter amylovorans]|uniref:histidine kinase n=1 Tax=Flaviaesturariibacter amylovorans TaxID=1084520 RepID=A0ABP8H7H1_9BACT
MRLRTKYLLFIFFLHAVTLVLSFFVFRENKLLFLVTEAVILFSLWLAWGLYRELIRPLKTLMTGVEAIRDRDFNVRFLPTGKWEMDQLISVYNSMIDQLRTERTRQEQQHFFLEKLIATAPTGIIILDFDFHIEGLNPKAELLLRMEGQTVRGKKIGDLPHPLLQAAAALASGEARTVSINGVNTYRLQVSHFVDRGFPRHFLTIEELTAEILEAEKKVFGRVIRMMAHEVNNTVGPVNSILDSAAKADRMNDAQRALLQNALGVAVQRNNNLNAFMRNFADLVKLPPPRLRRMDLHALLRNLRDLMQVAAADRAIDIVLHTDETPWYIEGDEQQLEQALINIVKNAAEAIGQGGRISLETDRQRGELRIRDTGKGIAPDDAEKLFTPFYSTKRDGQGIGLMLVRDVLRQHGFAFSLRTEAPGDTVFRLALSPSLR